MSIEKMEYVIIAGLLKNLDRSLEKCVESGCFHMGDASKDVIDTSEGLKRLDEENPYRSFLRRIIAIETGDDFEFSEDSFEDITAMPESEAEEFVSDAEKEFNEATEEISQYNLEIKERNLILTQLRHLKGMNIDLGKFRVTAMKNCHITVTEPLFLFPMMMTEAISGDFILHQVTVLQKRIIYSKLYISNIFLYLSL